ncbi:MAG TPA: hypothetical protein VGH03_11155 [Caulobacteraceae bacterium]|jgi:hypothetical protein
MTDAAAAFSRSPSERFDIGGVIARTLVTLGRNLPLFALLAVLCIIVPAVISTALSVAFESALPTSNVIVGASTQGKLGNSAWIGLLSSPIYMYSFLYMMIVISSIVLSRDRTIELPRIISVAWCHILPLSAILLLSWAAIALGCMLFIVPGIILAVALNVVIPVRVAEGLGVAGSLKRSWTLTQGFRWQIFLVLLLMFLIGGAVALVVLLLVGAIIHNAVIGSIIAAALLVPLYVVVHILNVTSATVIYCELLKAKEGDSSSEVAAAFS